MTTLIFNKKPDLELILESLPTTEHRPDFLAKVSDEEGDFILHIEFQTVHDHKMPVRMVSYYGRILHKYMLPVYPIVMYLTPEDSHADYQYTSSIRNKHIITFNYDVKKLWEIKSKKIFEKKLYGLYPLAWLIADADPDECLRNPEYAIEHGDPDRECYVCARVLAELKYPPEVVKEMIGDELLKQSTFYKETLEEGLSKGEEKGVAIGSEEGILSTLAARFGAVPDRLSRRIHRIRERNSSLLDDLLKLVVTTKGIGEFERKLGEMG